MLVQFGMGENIGQKIICETRSINPEKIFVQNVGKVVRLTLHADIAFVHQNVSQLPNMMIMSKRGMSKTVQEKAPRSLPVIL